MIMYFGNFHTPLVCEGKLQNQTEKEFLGPNEASPEYFPGSCYIDIYLDLACPPVYIGRIPVNCQCVSDYKGMNACFFLEGFLEHV